MRSLIFTLAIVACSYDDPTVNGSFKCTDADDCAGGLCVNGTCTAADTDGPLANGDGVKCGSSTCATGMQCCAGPIQAPICQPAGTACVANGAGAATCDGTEDCESGQACCGTTTASCGPSNCNPQVCLTRDDCLAGAASCCFDLTYLPWGFCC